MLSKLCLVCSKNKLSIQEKSGYMNLLLDINDGFAVLPTLNLDILKCFFDDVLLELTDREEKVIRLSYGFDSSNVYSIQDISNEFNISRNTVQKIKEKGIRKLKHPSRLGRLKNKVFLMEDSIYNDESEYSIYKTNIIELFKSDVDNYKKNKDFHTLYSINYLKNNVDNICHTNKINNTSIDDMDFSVRTYNCLKRAEIYTLSDILKLDYDQLSNIRNLGKRSFSEILEKLYVFISTKFSFDDFNDDEYPLMDFIKNINPETIVNINLKDLINNSIEYYNSTSIDSLFDASLSPGLINILLMHGYTNFKSIILNTKDISSLLNNYPKKYLIEYQDIVEKYTDVSVVVNLDIKLLNLISSYNISNLKELVKYSEKIKEKEEKDKVEKIIKTIEEYDYSFIKEYVFQTEHSDVSNDLSSDDFDLSDLDEIFKSL